MGRQGTSRAAGSAAVVAAAAMAFSGASAAWSLAAAPERTGSSIAHFGMIQHGTRACASCHGANGEGDLAQNAPRLAGEDEAYLERQLRAFRDGRRYSLVMGSVARTLDDEDRAAVARYYASLPAIGEARARTPGLAALGGAIAHQGDWARKVPPCASCHGADGLGVGASFPPLAGQRADYLERQLIRFRWNDRRDDPLGLMRGVAARLSAPEIRAVAAYYATLPPRAPSPPTFKATPPTIRPAPAARPRGAG